MGNLSSPTPDATTGSKGKVQLAGNLGGTAASPTVTGAQATTITGTALSGTYRQNTQADTTNVTQTGAIYKDGWGYFNPSSGTTATKAITWPTAFPSSIILIECGPLGAKVGAGAPTSISDFTTGIGGEVVLITTASAASTSGVTFQIYKNVAFSSATTFYGFWWRAIGT